MALTVSATFTVTEGPTSQQVTQPDNSVVTVTGYVITLAAQGRGQFHASNGPDRETAIQGLRNWGFTVVDN